MLCFVNLLVVGLNLFLDPNTTAIEHVLTFHLLYCHLLYRHLLYRHLLYHRVLYLHLLYRHWIIPTSTRPSLDLRSPSAAGLHASSGAVWDSIHDTSTIVKYKNESVCAIVSVFCLANPKPPPLEIRANPNN